MKTFDHELTSGSLLRSVWKIAWPSITLNLINGLPPLINQILIGHYVPSSDNAANAAVGTAWQVFLVVVVFISSVFHGMNVLVSQAAGRRDRETLSRVVYQAFLSSMYILPLIVAPLGILASPAILHLMKTPPDVADFALPYLRILFAGCTPMFLMFMFTNAFQSSGEARLALALGILTAVSNLVISSSLIIGVGPLPVLGVWGAAVGNVLAPTITATIAIYFVWSGRTHVQMPERWTLIPDLKLLRTICAIGVPSGVQGVVLNIGGVMLIWYINGLGETAALSAYSICYQYIFNLVSWTSFGLRVASSTLMGQNIGANEPLRGKQAVTLTAQLGALWAAALGILFWTIPEQLVRVFGVTDPHVVTYSVELLHFLTFSGVFLAMGLSFTGGLQGAGYTTAPMVIAILTQIGVLLGVCQIFVFFHALTPAHVWLAILISHGSRLILTYAVFRGGDWAHRRIEVAH